MPLCNCVWLSCRNPLLVASKRPRFFHPTQPPRYRNLPPYRASVRLDKPKDELPSNRCNSSESVEGAEQVQPGRGAPWHLSAVFQGIFHVIFCFSRSVLKSRNRKVLKSSRFFVGQTSERRRSSASPFCLNQKRLPKRHGIDEMILQF